MKPALVVDGDPSAAQRVAQHLTRMGFTATVAVHYDEVLRAVFERPPRLLCVSLSLPCNSGYDVCEAVRSDERLAHVQILVMSDRATPQEMAWAEEAGANAFLRKPFTAQELEAYVNALIDPRLASRPEIRRLRRPSVAQI